MELSHSDLVSYRVGFIVRSNVTTSYRDFFNSATHKEYLKGRIFPFEYIWKSAGLAGFVIILLCVYSFRNLLRQNFSLMYLCVAGVTTIYLSLLVASVGFERFVVYGRLSRQLIPFLIPLAAIGLTNFYEGFTWEQRDEFKARNVTNDCHRGASNLVLYRHLFAP